MRQKEKRRVQLITMIQVTAALVLCCQRTQLSLSGLLGTREREREISNSKTLFYKDCSLHSVKNLGY